VSVPGSRRTSCGLLILVDEPAGAVASLDLVDLGCCATGEWSWGSSLLLSDKQGDELAGV
jgi:hypothetical protein